MPLTVREGLHNRVKPSLTVGLLTLPIHAIFGTGEIARVAIEARWNY